jgi:dihydroxy-acid dehydratase
MSQSQTKEPSRFLDFKGVPYGTERNGALVMNRFSSVLTNGHDFPGAQAMLYAAGVKNLHEMRNTPQVGTARPGLPEEFQDGCAQ